jgi:hypothetical protein
MVDFFIGESAIKIVVSYREHVKKNIHNSGTG